MNANGTNKIAYQKQQQGSGSAMKKWKSQPYPHVP